MNKQRVLVIKLLTAAAMSLLLVLLVTSPVMAAATLADGEYTINYEILRGDTKDDSTSLADGYWNKPAKVFVKDGNITVQTTINQHAWVTEFATQLAGKMVDAKVVSTNKEANSRVVEFKVNSFDEMLLSSMTVDIPEMDYFHSYEARFKFYPDSLKLVAKAAATPSPTTTPKPTAKPATTPKVTPEPTNETTNTINAEPSTSNKPKAPTETVAATSPENEGLSTASPDSNASASSADKTDDIKVIDIGDIAAERENEGSSLEEDVDASIVLTKDDDFVVTEEGITANEALDATTEVETDQFTVDIEEKQGGTIAIIIIIIIAVIFIAGAIVWMVVSRKRNNQ